MAAGVAAGWAALASFLPVAVVVTLLQAAEDAPFALGVSFRVAAAGWLLAHGVPLQTGAGPVGLAPLALTVLAAWRVARAGVHVTRVVDARRTNSDSGPRRRSRRSALVAAVGVAVAYGAIGALVATIAGGSGWDVAPSRAGLTLGVFGLVAASYGYLRGTTAFVPAVLRDGVRTGFVAVVLVLAAGAATAGVAVAIGGGAAADTIGVYHTGVAGQAGLTLLCLAYAPNLAVWAAAYLIGPGFAVGTDTVVRSSEVVIDRLPALPVFAGLPDGPLPGVGAGLLAVPTLAGFAAGWLLARRRAQQQTRRPAGAADQAAPRPPGPRRGATGWPGLLGGALLAGPVVAGLLGVAAVVSGGPLGAGHLAAFGPVSWHVAGLSAVLVTAGTVLGAAVTAGLSADQRT